MSLWLGLAGTDYEVRTVDCGGVPTRALRAGRGRPVLLLHGFAGHLELFGRIVGPLAAAAEVHAIDLIGHGLTGKPSCQYSIATYVDHVRAYMDAVGLARMDVVGQSLGGWIAARIAVDHPASVDRLVLSCPGGTHLNAEAMAGLSERTLAAVRSTDPEETRRRLEFVLLNSADVTEELVEVRHFMYRQDDFQAIVERLNELQEPQFRISQLLTTEDLARVHAPTLVIWTSGLTSPTSGEDRWPASEGQFWQEHIPGAHLEVIGPCGHAPAWEQPQRFFELVRDFLARG
jgi:2-hydroxy-6-oxonona-2,4-dienedioate hydrolase